MKSPTEYNIFISGFLEKPNSLSVTFVVLKPRKPDLKRNQRKKLIDFFNLI